MAYEAGKKRLQYRCKKCGLVSPHTGKCFRCGSLEKIRVAVPEIVPKRNKGQSININIL